MSPLPTRLHDGKHCQNRRGLPYICYTYPNSVPHSTALYSPPNGIIDAFINADRILLSNMGLVSATNPFPVHSFSEDVFIPFIYVNTSLQRFLADTYPSITNPFTLHTTYYAYYPFDAMSFLVYFNTHRHILRNLSILLICH